MASEETINSRPFPFWKKALVTLGVLCLIGGLGLMAWGMVGGDSEAVPVAGGPEGGLVGGGAEASEPEPDFAEKWSPILLSVGGGFLVGLAIGMFLRSFLALTLGTVVLVALVIAGLQYLDFLDVDWEAVQSSLARLWAGVSGEVKSLRAFLAGRLPAAVCGVFGLLVGLKR